MTERQRQRRVWWTLWFPVVLAFLLIIAAWVTVIVIATRNPAERLPVGGDDGVAAEKAEP